MSALFESVFLNGMNMNNRFVRSATWEGLAEKDGSVTTKLNEIMVGLARNEVGLIISGYTFVSPEGQSSPFQMAVYDDSFLPGLRDTAEAVHSAGGKIALQLGHGGRFSSKDLTGMTPIRELEIFLSVAEHLHFGRASQACNLSPSALMLPRSGTASG